MEAAVLTFKGNVPTGDESGIWNFARFIGGDAFDGGNCGGLSGTSILFLLLYKSNTFDEKKENIDYNLSMIDRDVDILLGGKYHPGFVYSCL